MGGLRRGEQWAWVLTLLIGALYSVTACLPIDAFLLYCMLNNEVRPLFLPQGLPKLG